MRLKSYLTAAAVGILAPATLATPAFADHGDGSLSSFSSQADRDGDFSFIIEGDDLNPRVDYRLHSEGLNGACRDGNSLQSNPEVESDLDGDFHYSGWGRECIDGTYRVDVSEQSSPWRTFETTVTVSTSDSSSGDDNDDDDDNGDNDDSGSNPLEDVIGLLPSAR